MIAATAIIGLCCAGLAFLLWRSRRDRVLLARTIAEMDSMFKAVRIGTWSHNLISDRAYSKGRLNELYGFASGGGEYKFNDIVAAVHPDDRGLFLAHAHSVMEGKTQAFEMEHRVVWPDGSIHWVLAHGGVSEYQGLKPACLSGMNLDITARKEMELRLRTSESAIRSLNETLEERIQLRGTELAETERRLRLTIAALTDYAIFMLDIEGRITSWNQGAHKITGYTADEIMGKHLSIFYPSDARYNGHPDEELRIAAAEGRYQEEGWRICKGGSRIWANVLITAVRDDEGNLCGFLKVTRDRTERKRVEEQLEAERARAEEANRAKSEFLAAMSHEIRTPMNAILGMAELLCETELDEEQRNYVQIFRHAGADLMELINDILDLSKIEAGRVELEKVPFDLEDVLDHVMELLGSKARDKGIVVLARLAPGVTKNLVGDPGRLRQVLVNLVGNAVKFTHKGEVLVTAANVSGGREGEIEFSVSDSGIGIPAHKLPHIFEAFTQVDASTTRQYGGTGLGLTICKMLVERMAGSLTVESELGKGSTFRFNAQFGVHQETVRKMPAGVENLRGQRVLVMDDSATNRLILRESLTALGLESREFATVEEALTELRQSVQAGTPYGLVIADHHMPGMGGFDAAPLIRDLAPGIAILILTSDSQMGDQDRRREAGIAGFAVKPVKRSELLRLVCEALKVSGPAQGNSSRPGAAVAIPQKQKRVLVADDSADNQFLIEAYLKGSAFAVTPVSNGRAAVESFSAHPCDLILMDLRMPEMDGLEATRAIRLLERERGWKAVPVIALTANAQPQDVEKTSQAGCNAHLAKPVSKADLLRTLAEHCGDSIDRPIVVNAPEGLEDLVPRYLSARRQELPELVALSESADFDKLKSIAHNLKGTGTSYGFPDLTEIGAEMETSAGAGDQEKIRQQLVRLSRYLDRVRLRTTA